MFVLFLFNKSLQETSFLLQPLYLSIKPTDTRLQRDVLRLLWEVRGWSDRTVLGDFQPRQQTPFYTLQSAQTG